MKNTYIGKRVYRLKKNVRSKLIKEQFNVNDLIKLIL